MTTRRNISVKKETILLTISIVVFLLLLINTTYAYYSVVEADSLSSTSISNEKISLPIRCSIMSKATSCNLLSDTNSIVNFDDSTISTFEMKAEYNNTVIASDICGLELTISGNLGCKCNYSLESIISSDYVPSPGVGVEPYKYEFSIEINASLPTGYTQLEYIYNGGETYKSIDTGIKEFDKLEIVYEIDPTIGQSAYGWGFKNDSNNEFYAQWYDVEGSSLTSQFIIRNTFSGQKVVHVVKGEKSVYRYEGDISSSSNNFCLFSGIYYESHRGIKGKIYSATFYNDNILIGMFIPAKRNSDNKVGMYDVVTGTFHTNSSSRPLLTFTGGPSLDLPDTYQRVEYIKTTGTQYIDTGLTINQVDEMNTNIIIDSIPEEISFLGTRSNSNYNNFLKYNENGFYLQYNTSSSLSTITPEVNKEYEIRTVLKEDSQKMYINNDLSIQTINATPYSDSNTMYLFSTNNTSGGAQTFFYGKTKNVQLYKDRELVLNLVPCYRKSDSVVGMYDTVNGAFYTNQGTGSFIKGPDTNSTVTLYNETNINDIPTVLLNDKTIKIEQSGLETKENYNVKIKWYNINLSQQSQSGKFFSTSFSPSIIRCN